MAICPRPDDAALTESERTPWLSIAFPEHPGNDSAFFRPMPETPPVPSPAPRARPRVTIFTDGACEGNPGPGGWAAVLLHEGKRKEIAGAEPATTNNRMEMTAALNALKVLKASCEIVLWTDSTYLRDGITKWIRGWKAKGWRTSTKEPVKNADLWQAIDAAAAKHQITWQWVRGHSGHRENERCDELAVGAAAVMRKKYTPAQLRQALTDFRRRTDAPAPGGDSLL